MKINAVSSHVYYTAEKRSDRAKTVCTSHVLAALGIDQSEYRYSATEPQMMAVARRCWSCRSVRSRLASKATVGGSRAALDQLSKSDREIVAYIVIVDGHALLLDTSGRTIVDTSPRKRDARRIVSIYAVRNK